MATALSISTLTRQPGSDQGRDYALRLRMALSLATASILALIAVRNPPLVALRHLSVEHVVGTLAALALISAFLERAVEVFVAAWRVGEQQQLEIKLERMRAARSSGDDVKDCRLQISQFRHETRMYAVAASLILGILVSLAGVRALAAIVEFRAGRSRVLAREALQCARRPHHRRHPERRCGRHSQGRGHIHELHGGY